MKKIKRFIKAKKLMSIGYIETINEYRKAKEYEIPFIVYAEEGCKSLEAEQLEEFAKKEHIIQDIKKEANWSRPKTISRLKRAKRFGVLSSHYRYYKCHTWTDEQIQELGRIIRLSRSKAIHNREWYTRCIQEKCGCTYEEAKEKLRICRSKGYPLPSCIARGLYALDIKELEAYEEYKPIKYASSDFDKYIKSLKPGIESRIMEEMGWSRVEYELKLLRATVNCGCTFDEYHALKLYKLTDEQQKEYVTTEIWMKLYLRHCDYADSWKYLKEKTMFNDKFSEFVGRKWMMTDDMTIDQFKEFVKNQKELFYKPTDAACGKGICKYPVNASEEDNLLLFDSLKQGRSGIIEHLIKQHEGMSRINPFSVNTIRVQVMMDNGKAVILNTLLRTGGANEQYTDNFSSGGIVAAIDTETGVVLTDGVDKQGEQYSEHPVSGVSFKGFKIPNWKKVIEICEKASNVLENNPYVGWDVVINNDGTTQLIEGNHDADATIHQFPWAICEQRGIREKIDKYIWFDGDRKTV